jgi:RNA polymerase sigma factor (sigma-70 family)
MLRQMIDTLAPREALIQRRRFGLEGGKPKTLDEIGQELGVTREQVRQIQKRCLGRTPPDAGKG